MATNKKPAIAQKPMAYVEIGYRGYLLPLSDAQRLVAILAGAVIAKKDYRDTGWIYEIEHPSEPITLSLDVVQPKQVVVREEPAEPPARRTKAIVHEMLKLTGPAR